MRPWRRAGLAVFISLAVVIAAIAVVFQDNLTRYGLNPRTPYQLYTPPPPPAYGARGAWALWPDSKGRGEADVFYLHSTTYASRKHWNGPITDNGANAVLRRVAAPNEAGPFMQIGAVYGPRYRQATLFATFTHKFDGLAARRLAYGDVKDAFEVFLKETSPDRPIILAGYDQGGLYVLGLLRDYFADDDVLRARLAAAYVIRHPTDVSLFENDLKATPPCRSKEAVGCVVAYIDLEERFGTEKRRYRQRSLAWTGDMLLESRPRSPQLCVNPISWRLDGAPAPAADHVGAASATGLRMGETPPAIAGAIGAQCIDGILQVDKPRQTFLRRRHWFGDHWRPQDSNLFYHDLSADGARRAGVVAASLAARAGSNTPQVDLADEAVNNAGE